MRGGFRIRKKIICLFVWWFNLCVYLWSMNNAQNNSTMTTIDLTSAKRLTFKAMTTATAGLGKWGLKSGTQWANGVYFPETNTLVKVDPTKRAALIEFCRGSLTKVDYTPPCVWEWGA